MANIPTQAGQEVAEVHRAWKQALLSPGSATWKQAGLGPDSVVDLGDGTSMTLRELLGETQEERDDE